MSGHEKPDAPGLWKAAHGGYGVMFHDDGEPAMLLFGPGAKVRALDAIGPYTRLQPGVPVGSAPVPNLPGLWMDKDGSLYFLSGGRRVWRIRDDHDWMAEELGNDPWELSKHGPYARYSLQAAEEVPWKPASDDSTPIHEGSRTVHLPDVRSFGRLEQDKWLAVKNLEESAALIEADRNVLAARANHPGQSLADLYDPDYMPTDLRAAHRELDKIADVAFGARKWLKDDDDTRLQVLFKSYTRMTGSSGV